MRASARQAAAPDGWPSRVTTVRPGREHGAPCARAHGLGEALNRLATTLGIPTLTDLSYENAAAGFRHPVREPEGGELTAPGQVFDAAIRASTPSPYAPTPCSKGKSAPNPAGRQRRAIRQPADHDVAPRAHIHRARTLVRTWAATTAY